MVQAIGSRMVQIPKTFRTRMTPGIMEKRHAHSWQKPEVAAAMAGLRTDALPVIAGRIEVPTTLETLKDNFVTASFECSVEASVYSRAFGEIGVEGEANSLLRHYDEWQDGAAQEGETPSFAAIVLQLSGFTSPEELQDHEVALARLLNELARVTDFKMEVLDGPKTCSGTAKYLYLEMLMVQKKMVNDFVKNLLATAEANIEENAAAEINKRYAAGGYY